ncbi:MAG: hypothetical protein JWO93_2304 [Micrococcaceae bacterium]|nr:hypothetical protein [Micrococcaceae bacterium]
MRSPRRFASVAALALALTLAGCSTGAATSSGSGSSTITPAGQTSVGSSGSTPSNATVIPASLQEDTHFDADDLIWDASKEVAVTLTDGASSVVGASNDGVQVDGNKVTISAGGTYRLSGALTDGQLVVAAGAEDVVRVILDGVELTSSTGSPFVINEANEVLVYLADGSDNALSDAQSYANTADGAPNAALYSLADLTIAGSGALTVTGNANDGIVSKDGLVLAAGNVTVVAADDGIRGKDYVVLLDGNYQVAAGGDGVKSDNEEDEGRGWLLISGGTMDVTAGDDGIKAFDTLTITGGTATVAKSNEGLEAQHIALTGGTITVNSTDDGINAAGGSSSTTTATTGGAVPGGGMPGGGMDNAVGNYSLDISGGTITVNAAGDGLDSNGNATVSGGTTVVNGPTNDGNGALDVNGDLTVSGGTLAAAGSSGMAVTPATASPQSAVQLTFASSIPAGTVIHIADGDGNVVATFTTTKTASSLIFSSPAIRAGETYTAYTGGTSNASVGLGSGSLDGATKALTALAGQYTAARGPGGR